jgi:hypothetical protein
MKDMKEANQKVLGMIKKVDNLEKDVRKLQEDNKKCHDIIINQQRFMEMIDSRERGKNVIITGVKENRDELGDNDSEKVQSLFNKIGQVITPQALEIKRLGRPNDRNKRPMLVCLPDKGMRKSILEKAKALHEEEEPYKRAYIKKDMHPAVRREFDRLNKVHKEEKDKPGNAGKNIVYDHKRREITCDGLVIDRFNLSFF